MKAKITLNEARKKGDLSAFEAEHANDPAGDEDAFNRALASMAGKSKPAPETSKPDHADD